MLPDVLLFCAALLLAAWSLLTAVRVPVAVNWKLALVAGELGPWLAVVAAGVVAGAVERGGLPGLRLATLLAGGAAVILFLKPAVQAWRISRGLPARLEQAFGWAEVAWAPFSWPALFAFSPKAEGAVETLAVAPGLGLDFYRASGSAGAAPCVVVIHGGGWDAGDRRQLPGLNRWLQAQGYAVAAISYRLAPAHPWPAQRDDVQAALAWLKERAAELGIDAGRLVLLGRSAGGQIATAAGYAGDPAIRGVVAFYAPHDMRFAWSVSREDDALNSLKLMRQLLGGPPEGRGEIYDTASGQSLVRPGVTPPTLLLHGTIDTLVWVRHSRRLAVRLEEAGVPQVLVELPWATHAFEVHLHGPGGQLTAYALAHFLAAVTRI